MKNNIENFVKYKQNDLSLQEKLSFNEKLAEDSDFKIEYFKFSDLYDSLKNSIEIDERYFSSIIPNAKKRWEKSKGTIFIKIALATPILIVCFFILFKFFSIEKLDSNYDFQNLLETFTENEDLTSDLLLNAFKIDNTYILNEELLSKYYEDDIQLDETVFEYLERSLVINNIDYNLINELSDDEFNSVYTEIIDKKNIIGVK